MPNMDAYIKLPAKNYGVFVGLFLLYNTKHRLNGELPSQGVYISSI